MLLYRENLFQPFTLFGNNKTSNALLPTSNVNSLRVECIKTKKEFHQLKDQWNELVSSSESRNPFMLWEWLYSWWDVFENKNQLYILAVYEGKKLISVAPFYIKKSFYLVKQLAFLGEGEKKSDAIVTHYPDIVVSEAYRRTVIDEIVNYLKKDIETDNSFHFSSFDLIKENSVIQDVSEGLSSKLSNKFLQESKINGYQFLTRLPSEEDEFIASLSRSARKQFRLKNNRLNKLGDIEIQSESCTSKGLKEAERLHRSRWSSVNESSVFDSENFKLFHQKLSERLQGQYIFDIRTMSLNGENIVVSYNLNYKDTCYSYLSGFESKIDKRLSPVFTFDVLEIKRLIREGYFSFDLLVSEDKDSYKKRFGGDVLNVHKIMWFKSSPLSILIKKAYDTRPHLAKIYRKFKPI